MTGYKFYLTKSREVADLLCEGLRGKLGKGSISSVRSGYAHEGDSTIPALYHNDGWFYTVIEYEGLDRPKYEIVFA